MKKKVLVLGASGMLGIEVIRHLLKENITLFATIRNFSDKKKIKNYLNSNISNIKFYKFSIKGSYAHKLKKIVKNKDYIVNCIGLIKPYISENNIDDVTNAININSIFPYRLNDCVGKNTKIFQIATDCVYDGKKGDYKENDSHDAIDVYGKTKSLGEIKSKNFFNIRCSIIGKEIKNFNSLLCWFLNQKKNSQIFGFKNHLWNGITTNHFGKIISALITQQIKIPNLIHIMPNDTVNKYKLLKLFQEKFKRHDLKIKEINAKFVVNRTLKTKFKNINKKINNSLGLKKAPNINHMIKDII